VIAAMPRRPSIEHDFPPPVRLVEPTLPVELPAPPSYLSDEMKNFWRTTVADYDLQSHHLLLLQSAADAWDRMVQARTTIAEEGLVIEGANGKRQHPCIAIERDSRIAFSRILREMDLDEPMPAPGPYHRPPAIRSNRRR
jgi:phage terminase small subunit